MKKYGNEFKVGIIIVLALAGLGYMTLKAGDFHFKKEGYRMLVIFDNIMGLEEKAPVLLRGYEVGQVENISVNYGSEKTEIALTLWIDDAFKIRGIPVISIKTLGLMGEKYIQIVDETDKSDFLKPDTILRGKNPGDFEELMDVADTVAKNTNDLILEVKSLAQNVNGTLQDNKDAISGIVNHMEGTSRNLEEFSADIKNHPWKLLFKTKEKTIKDN